jgi:hypothetical protein
LIIAALPLVACATPAERQLQKITTASEQLWIEYHSCMTNIERTAAYQRLDRAFILKGNDPRSIEKMGIDRFARDQEKADLLENKKTASRCNQYLFNGFAEVNPGFTVLMARFTSEDDELVLRTIQDEVTVGARNLIAHQRFAQRLGDWNYAGERIVRLYTWHLRRRCSIYCSSFSAASLLPTYAQGMSNVATAIPPSLANGQKAKIAAVPAAQEAEIAAAPATQEAELTPVPPPQETKIAAVPAVQEAEIAAAPATQEAELTPVPPPQEPEIAAMPAVQMASPTLEPSMQEADTGLEPAAGPADEPTEPREQRVKVASTLQTVQPRYTVHLASMRSEVEARAEWGHLQARYPVILSDRVLFTREVRISGKGTYVRVLTGLFHNRGQARDLCSRFGSDKQYCAVMRLETPPSQQ